MNELVPILGIIAVFGSPIAIVWLAIRGFNQKRKLIHETINKLIEKDQPIPVDMIKAFEARKPIDHLQAGILLLFIGLGVGIFLTIVADLKIASFAAIPLCLGIGFLTLARLGKSKGQEITIDS